MTRQAPFTEHEAVILLDAFLQTEFGDVLRRDAIKKCSDELRCMATANGLEIDDTYRNMNGITFQMASMESAYHGKTIVKPATRLFTEIVNKYINDREEYERLLNEARLMLEGKQNNEAQFMAWLSKQVSPAQLSELYMVFQEIEQQAKKEKLVRNSLFEKIDTVLYKKLKINIEQSKTFKFSHKRQMGRIYSALNYLFQYAQEQSDDKKIVPAIAPSPNEAEPVVERKYKHDDKEDFYQWMLNDQHMAEESCRSYVSAIRGAEKFASEHGFKWTKLFGVTVNEARLTADGLFCDAEFLEQNEIQHNRFRAAITKLLAYIGGDWTASGKVIVPKTVEIDVDKHPFCTVLIESFPRGYRLGSSLEMKKFRRYFENINKVEMQLGTDEAETVIRACGIEHDGRIYAPQTMLSEELRDRVFGYIDQSIDEGRTVIYFEALFREFSEEFLDHNIYDVDMLKAYIAYLAGDKYFIARNYLSNEKRVLPDPIEDVRTCLQGHGIPMEVTEICQTLSHIPEERIRTLLSTNGEFVRNSKGEYFHVDSFSVTEEELDNISSLIKSEIDAHDFISGNELYDAIKSKYLYIYERNQIFSVIGWRDALKYKLGERYSFNGNIISSKEQDLSMSDVFTFFAKNQRNFSLQELLNFAENIGSTIYYDALYKNAARVSRNQFVPRDSVHFQVKETDKILDQFCIGNYIALPKINDFGIFPEASHPWTPFLLEHYLALHSGRYYLLHGGYNQNVVVGAMVKKNEPYENFDELVTDILAESEVELQNKTALNYLFDNGYIARRSYTGIELLLINARAKRNKKEK